MKAILYDPSAANGLSLTETPEPEPTPQQALISVEAFAINFADVAFLKDRFQPSEIVGFETSGLVLKAAVDGSGPFIGTRVVGFSPKGGWAERRAINSLELVPVPPGLETGAAAALPVAGVTALRALRCLGAVIGRRVLVTGASGGVERMAVQLAARAGAYVIACVGSAELGVGLSELGANQVVVGLDQVEPVFGVLDNVGGLLLARAFELLEPNGLIQSIGMASLEPTSIDFEQARLRGGGRIEAFNVFSHGGSFAKDLPPLLELAAQGQINSQIGWRDRWTKFDDAIEAFRGRRIRGKAVLDVT